MAERFRIACEIVCHDVRYVGRFEQVVDRAAAPSEREAKRLLDPTIVAALDRIGGQQCPYEFRWLTITPLGEAR